MSVNYDVYETDDSRYGVQYTVRAYDVRNKEGFLISEDGQQDESIVYVATALQDAFMFNRQYVGNIVDGLDLLNNYSVKNIRLACQLETGYDVYPRYMRGDILGTESFLSPVWNAYRYITSFDAVKNCLLVYVHIMNRTSRNSIAVLYDDFTDNAEYESLLETGYDDTRVVIGFSTILYSSVERYAIRLKNDMILFPIIEYTSSRPDKVKTIMYGNSFYGSHNEDYLSNLINPLHYHKYEPYGLSSPSAITHWYGGQYSISAVNANVSVLTAAYDPDTPGVADNTNLTEDFITQNYEIPDDWLGEGIQANGQIFIYNNEFDDAFLYNVFSLERIQKVVSSLGMYWTGNLTSATESILGNNCTDAKIHLGIIDDDGYTHGDFVSGRDCVGKWQNSVTDIVNDRIVEPVDPLNPPSPPVPPSDDGEDDTRKRNEDTNLPSFDGIRLVSGTGFSTFYLLSSYHVAELGALLSSMPQTFWEALGTATDYRMSNVLDYISALKWYPLDIHATAPANFPDVQTADMQFGFNGTSKVTFTADGTSFKLGTVNRVYDMGSIFIPYRSSSGQTFLDLEPYTDVYINLPYIGKTQLQANQVLGYTISVHYVIDLITGMCTCIVDNGYDTLYVGGGKIGVDITVTGNDIITQAERMTSAYVGTVTHGISNALSLGGALTSEDATGAVSGYSNLISGIVSDCISTANAKRGIPQVVGGGSGFGSTYTAQSPCIIVQRPPVKIPAAYGHSVGYVYNTHTRIGTLSGYTVCDNPDLSGVSATSKELDMIKNILCTGFYA